MAVGWALWKGKRDEPSGAASAALEVEGSSSSDQDGCCSCLDKGTIRWIVTLVLSLQLLVFVVLSFPIHGKHHGRNTIACHEAPVIATFKLQRASNFLKSSQLDLERNMSVHFSNMKVVLMKLVDIKVKEKNWTQVQFALYPEPFNRTLSSDDLDSVRGNLVKLFLRKKSISLAPFGKVYDFQIDRLKGGITIVPKQADASLSRRSALFNFTLHNSTIDHVNEHYSIFKSQLARGLCLQPKENLITRLTNLNGSTAEPPVIVRVSVFKAVGHRLSHLRLKQLARRLTRHRRNLGLNHTMFGKVRELQLSSVLGHYLEHPHAQAPGPAPMHAPSPGPTPPYSFYSSSLWPVVQAPATAPQADPLTTGVGFEQASSSYDSPLKRDEGPSSYPAASPSSSSGSCVRKSCIMVLVASTAAFIWF